MAGISNKRIQGGITKVKNIVAEKEKEDAIHQQEYDDRNISCQAAEKLAEFFFTNGPHGY